MLKKIEYIFPINNKNIELFNLFFTLFKNIDYVKFTNKKEINIIPSNLNPKTIFKLEDSINNIQLNIGENKFTDFLSRYIESKDNVNKSKEYIKLSISDVLTKLDGHITRIDHTGINLPTKLFDKEEWNDLIKYFSFISNLYNYPTGQPWPFLIPATKYENENEISNFKILREPKFELVYDEYTNVTTIHIDIETDLSELEVENLFPDNQGVYFKECPYKAIYLDYREDMDIRLDIRAKCIHDNWESGEWLVCEGKRIKSN